MPRLFTRVTLIVAALGVAQLAPSVAGSDTAYAAKAKKKKKAKAKKEKVAAAAPAPKKFTVQSVLRMHKEGLTDDEIVARANETGYKLSAKDKATLKKGHAPKSLIAALDPNAAAEEAAPAIASEPAKAKPIDISKMTDPNDIDFDSVAPPPGVPQKYVQGSSSAPKKPQAAPAPAPAPTARAEIREEAPASKPAAAPAPQPKPQVASSSTPGKRVVFTPGQ